MGWLVAHRPAVDEEKLLSRRAAREGRQARVARQANVAARGIDGQRVFSEVGAEDRT